MVCYCITKSILIGAIKAHQICSAFYNIRSNRRLQICTPDGTLVQQILFAFTTNSNEARPKINPTYNIFFSIPDPKKFYLYPNSCVMTIMNMYSTDNYSHVVPSPSKPIFNKEYLLISITTVPQYMRLYHMLNL